jgi:inositol polyphosphate-4-phosphatase
MDTLTDPHAVGKSSGFGSVIVTLTVNSLEAYDWITRIRGTSPTQAITAAIPKIQVIPVLFNLGVNEMQSVANVAGTKAVDVQTEINRKGANQLRAYYEACIKASVKLGSASSEERLPSLLTTLEEHVETEARQRGKLVELLLVSCYVARLLNGARTTSCKSAKDRTSMFHSLEVVRLAEQWGWIDRSVRLNIFLSCRSCSCRANSWCVCRIRSRVLRLLSCWLHRPNEQAILDELRGPSGVRLQNCLINTGNKKYAFNQVQLQALPQSLRPPASTATGGIS